MLTHCSKIGSVLGIKFNAAKSNCFAIGPTCFDSKAANMSLGNLPVTWADKIKYLGITLATGRYFSNVLSEVRRKFFSSVNSILSKCAYVSDLVKLKLVETHCLPVLLYAIESMNLKRDDLSEVNSWWNAVYRKIFNYNKWESVKQLICLLGRLDVLHMENFRRINFIRNMTDIKGTGCNSIINFVISKYVNRAEHVSLTTKYGLQISWSYNKIRALSFISFSNIALT
jgi:hypothetical protein